MCLRNQELRSKCSQKAPLVNLLRRLSHHRTAMCAVTDQCSPHPRNALRNHNLPRLSEAHYSYSRSSLKLQIVIQIFDLLVSECSTTSTARSPPLSSHQLLEIANKPPLKTGTSSPGYSLHQKKSTDHVRHIFLPPSSLDVSSQVSGSKPVIKGTAMRRGFALSSASNATVQLGMGRTWQSRKTMASAENLSWNCSSGCICRHL